MKLKRLIKLLKKLRKTEPENDRVHLFMCCPTCGARDLELLLDVQYQEHRGINLRNYIEV